MYAHSDRVNGFKGDSMRRIGRTLGLSAVVALYWAWPAISQADPSLPNESGEDCLVTQSYDTILGLLVRDYSLRGNGQVNYRTARHIMGISFVRHPLFYWYDANQDGRWEMWIDRDEEGELANAARCDWRQGKDLITSSMTW